MKDGSCSMAARTCTSTSNCAVLSAGWDRAWLKRIRTSLAVEAMRKPQDGFEMLFE